jgi:receptor protein-tyrosine kinase
VQRDGGARVSVLEADFRRPTLGRMLGVDPGLGLADVLTGLASVDAATRTVDGAPPLAGGDLGAAGGPVATAVQPLSAGSLSVLLGSSDVANPPALLASPAMGELVRSLAEEFDSVLIDAPPPLEVSDVLPLLALVDGVIIVVRVGHTRDHTAARLAQLLAGTPGVRVLGAVVNCATPRDIERYGFSLAPSRGSGSFKLFGRR